MAGSKSGKGVELAVGYISLVAETKDIPKDVEKALKLAEKHGHASGQKVGKNMADGITGQLGGGAREAMSALNSGLAGQAPSLRNTGSMLARQMLTPFHGIGGQLKGILASELSGAERAGAIIGRGLGTAISLPLKGALAVGIGGAAGIAATAIGGLGYALAKGFSRLQNIDAAQQRLKALGLAGGQIKSVMTDVQQVIKGTPIAMDEAMGAVTVALGSGIKAGDELKGYLQSIADAAGFSGSSFSEMALVFGQVQAKGKLMGEEMMQLMERKIPIKTWLQETLGKTSDELEKMSAKGQISMKNLEDAVEQHASGMAKNLGNTIEGATANVKTSFARIGADILGPLLGMKDDGGTSGIAQTINHISDKLDLLDNWIKGHQGEMLEFFAHLASAATGAFEGILRGIQGFLRLGANIDQYMGWVTGDYDHAQQEAKSFREMADGIDSTIDAVDKAKGKINDFRDRTREATQFTKDLGGALTEINGDAVEITINDNTDEALKRIDSTKFAIEHMPDGKIKVVPLTAEAVAEMNAWREKQNAQPIVVPADVDLSNAQAKLGQLAQFYQSVFDSSKPLPTFAIPAAPPSLPGAPAAPGGGRGLESLFPGGTGDKGYLPYFPTPPGRELGGPGPVSGPGPKGSDSVLMLGAPGEHMLTADDVDAMGGQGAVYAFRSALHGGQKPKVPAMAGGGSLDEIIGGKNGTWRHGASGDSSARGAGPGRMTDLPGTTDAPGGGMMTPVGNVITDPDQMPGKNGSGPGYGGKGKGGTAPPKWGAPGLEWGPPSDDWWVKPIDPDNIMFPEYQPPGDRQRILDEWGKKKKKIKGYDDGGVPGQDPRKPVPGGAMGAIDFAATHAVGQPYQYGGVGNTGGYDCSGIGSAIYASALGLPQGQRYFTTESDFAALGFQRGYMPGALNVGLQLGGGGMNSHMTLTLPNGVNVESGGATGATMYGGKAKGAQGMPVGWYLPLGVGTGGAGGNGPNGGGGTSSVASGMPGGFSGGSAEAELGGGLGGDGSGRTQGYIPAAAGNTGVAGTSFAAGLFNMGAEAVNGLIDQAASAAATGVGAMTFGAGGGAAASAIGIGTTAAKRGVSYAFQMASIGTDALVEQLFPFGAPRWLGYDYTGFAPQARGVGQAVTSAEAMQGGGGPLQQTDTQIPGATAPMFGGQLGPAPGPAAPGSGPMAPPPGGAGQAAGVATAPGTAPNPAPANDPFGTGGSGPVAGMGGPGPQQQDPNNPQPQPTIPFLFDQGGWMEPGMVSVNKTQRPEPVLTGPQWDAVHTAAAKQPLEPAVAGSNDYSVRIENVTVKDVDELESQMSSRQRLQMMRYAGRP